jgi:hypothetical protein
MDGMLTRVVGAVDTEAGPRPFSTSDALAARAVGDLHARAMAEQARVMASQCRHNPAFRIPAAYDPRAAAIEAERQRVAIEGKRAFLADRLRGLLEAGKLTRAEFRAADEIAMILEWTDGGRQLLARSQFRERMASSSGDTVGAMAMLEEAERTRFAPWRAWASKFRVKRDRTLEQLTRAVAVQRLGLRQAGDAFGMDQRRVLALLKRSLGCYAVLAGWVGRGPLAA